MDRPLPRHYFRLDPEIYSIVKDRSFSACIEPCPHEGGKSNLTRERLVELIGIEPTTSGLQSPRSPS
jgi:hypothetical protein